MQIKFDPTNALHQYARVRSCASAILATILLTALVSCSSTGSSTGGTEAADSKKYPAAEADQKRAAIRKVRDEALADFYATRPEIKADVDKAIGYAVFDASQINIVLFVGGLGEGMLVENGTGAETFMRMTRAGTGPGIGYKSFRQLIVFKDRRLFDNFRHLGADVGASADLTFKIGDAGVTVDPNVSFNPLISVYQITDRGALLQANWGGVAYLPDQNLNP